MTDLEFTSRPYERSHGKRPRGRGSWAFQESLTSAGFDRDLLGEIFWVSGATLGEAKQTARAHFAGADVVAILP